MNLPLTLEELQQRHPSEDFKYLPFWGHFERGTTLTKACFSQWYPSPFHVNGLTFQTAEHYMMAGKARLFADSEVHNEILQTTDPGHAKKLGRKIRNFDEAIWRARRFEIVVAGNLAKFRQHQELASFLIGTRNRILVEASPVDRIWGIGLSQDHPQVENPFHWKGLNLLGFALMKVRQELQTK